MLVNVGGFGAAPKIVTQYMALFDNIIHHMRFPKFLEIVSQELGEEVSYFDLYVLFFCFSACWVWN